MKAKPRANRRTKPNEARATRLPAVARGLGDGKWRMADLPPELQAELRDRVEEAMRGENLIPFDEAVTVAERMADEIVEILNRPDALTMK